MSLLIAFIASSMLSDFDRVLELRERYPDPCEQGEAEFFGFVAEWERPSRFSEDVFWGPVAAKTREIETEKIWVVAMHCPLVSSQTRVLFESEEHADKAIPELLRRVSTSKATRPEEELEGVVIQTRTYDYRNPCICKMRTG